MKVVYITGCLGFIGSYITRKCLERGWMVYGIDKITYAANTALLKEFELKFPSFFLGTFEGLTSVKLDYIEQTVDNFFKLRLSAISKKG